MMSLYNVHDGITTQNQLEWWKSWLPVVIYRPTIVQKSVCTGDLPGPHWS